jgi:hypothetical protein
MTKEELEHYIAKYKEHEARRASTNERNAYWDNYYKHQKLDPETSFNMGSFT